MDEKLLHITAQTSYAVAERKITPLVAKAKEEGRSFDSVSNEIHERLLEFSCLKEQDISPEDKQMILALVRSEVIHLLDDTRERFHSSVSESSGQKPTVLEPMQERVFVAVNASMEAPGEQTDEESIGGTH